MTDLTTLKNWIALYEGGKLDATGLGRLYDELDSAAIEIEKEAQVALVEQIEREGLEDSDQEIMRKQHSLSRGQMGIL